MDEPTYEEIQAEAGRHEKEAMLAAAKGTLFEEYPFRGGKLFWVLRAGTCKHEADFSIHWNYLKPGVELTTYPLKS